MRQCQTGGIYGVGRSETSRSNERYPCLTPAASMYSKVFKSRWAAISAPHGQPAFCLTLLATSGSSNQHPLTPLMSRHWPSVQKSVRAAVLSPAPLRRPECDAMARGRRQRGSICRYFGCLELAEHFQHSRLEIPAARRCSEESKERKSPTRSWLNRTAEYEKAKCRLTSGIPTHAQQSHAGNGVLLHDDGTKPKRVMQTRFDATNGSNWFLHQR